MDDTAAAFERDYGCTEAEWQGWLPGAVRGHPLQPVPGGADVSLGGRGRLRLRWAPLPPRRIALLQLPRLAVRFEFDGVDAAARREFLRYFDLFMQRGGG